MDFNFAARFRAVARAAAFAMGENGELDMRYHHVNLAGELMTGVRHWVEVVD